MAIALPLFGVHIEKRLIENTEADYDYIFDINTRGVFFTSQEAGRRIVVVSTGGTKMHFANMSLYLGSKGAIEQFARSLALELGPREVTVNVLSPGFTDTDMLPEQYRAYGASLSPLQSRRRAGRCRRHGSISPQRRVALGDRGNIQAGGVV